eukprot:TRINITY_DN40275_c0_g1_i1.p1 TRINITY_DN40275_c0_g1~~TRINITY_DN40275_c0_g1_i1.p1  ORF type:complete len:360 (+),score=111.48 TRINITY_DN40275_c0_g1_i1:91-1080(+)
MAAVPAATGGPRDPPGRCFVFGAGEVGGRVLSRLRRAGWRTAGTARSEEEVAVLRREGGAVWRYDGSAPLPPAALAELRGASHVLSTAPPDSAGRDPVLSQCGGELQRAAKDGRLRWAGYLSSCGVYGDAGGAAVDESAPLRPATDTAARRLRCEAEWRALSPPLPLVVMRLAGLYGPGRSALTRLRKGEGRRLHKPGHVISRLHVEDAAAAVVASMHRPPPPGRCEVYNLADDNPASQAEVVGYAAELLGTKAPPVEDYAAAERRGTVRPALRKFYQASRRVSSDKARAELGWAPAYDDHRAGLRQCLWADIRAEVQLQRQKAEQRGG